MAKIKKAVIPAAGLGTRFLPATKAVPKEMIPIVDTPMIQLIVEEAVHSGIEDIVIITARQKEAIVDHFDFNYELEDTLFRRNKDELMEVSKRIANMCNIITIRQKNPLGLGHAVLTAEPIIGNEPFAVLLGDDLIDSEVPCTKQLIDLYQKSGKSVVAVMEVLAEEVSKYGIISGKKVDPRTYEVDSLVEKPDYRTAPSRLAIPGRYLLDAGIFDCIRRTKPGKGGEIQLTDALQIMASEKGLMAYEFEGTRYDTGDRLGYLNATIALALKRDNLRPALMQIMRAELKKWEAR